MKWIKKCKALILFLTANLFPFSVFANLPYYPIQFPRDDAAHHANVPYPIKNLTEWWYYNGKLTTTSGRNFGYFVAVFHIIPPGKREAESVLMVQLTDIDQQKVYGTTKLYPPKSTTFDTNELNVKLGNDFYLNKLSSLYNIEQKIKIPNAPKIVLNLTLSPSKTPLLINKTGLTDMYDGTNSYYYSNVRMKTEGTLQVGDDIFTVDHAAENSVSWMDHQWGDFVLSPQKSRWIWTSVQLDNGIDFSAWELIDPKTGKVVWKIGNIIMPDDSRFYTNNIDIEPMTRDKRSHYPARYRVSIYPLGLTVKLDSLAPHQDSNGFWEGAHAASGYFDGNKVAGFSYVENTVEYQKRK